MEAAGKLGKKKNKKKKVQVKKGKNAVKAGGEKEEEAKAEKKVEKKPTMENEDEDDEEDNQMVKIEELLSDLTLNDSEAVVNTELIQPDALTEFVTKLKNVTIEK